MITRFIQIQTEDLLRINDNHARHLYPRNSSEVGKLVLFPSLPSLQSLKGLVKSNGHGSRFGCLGGLGGWLVLYLLSKYCSCLGHNKGRHTRQVDTLVIAGALASGTSNLGCKDQASEISTSYIFPCFLHVHFVPVRNSHRFLQCLKKSFWAKVAQSLSRAWTLLFEAKPQIIGILCLSWINLCWRIVEHP